MYYISGNLVFLPFHFSFKDPFENCKLMGFFFSRGCSSPKCAAEISLRGSSGISLAFWVGSQFRDFQEEWETVWKDGFLIGF